MDKKCYTIVVMPPHGESRNYILGKHLLRLLLGLPIVFILILMVSVAWSVWLREQTLDGEATISTLKEANAQKAAELDEAREYLNKLKELDADIRKALFTDSEEVGLGQGGFDSEALGDVQASVSPSESTHLVKDEVALDLSVDEYARALYDRVQELSTNIDQRTALYHGFPSILPVQTTPGQKSYWFSSGYGYRQHPLTGKRQFHKGLDIATQEGTPIIAPADGVVTFVGQDKYLGRLIKIKHQSFQGEHETMYGHMKAFAKGLKEGDRVKRRDVIGYVGHTGRTTGSHLHYQINTEEVTQNPMRYIILDPQGIIQ